MTDSNAFYNLILPILNMVNGFTGTLLLIVSSLGAIQCIFLGVRFYRIGYAFHLGQAGPGLRLSYINKYLVLISQSLKVLSMDKYRDNVREQKHNQTKGTECFEFLPRCSLSHKNSPPYHMI